MEFAANNIISQKQIHKGVFSSWAVDYNRRCRVDEVRYKRQPESLSKLIFWRVMLVCTGILHKAKGVSVSIIDDKREEYEI